MLEPEYDNSQSTTILRIQFLNVFNCYLDTALDKCDLCQDQS
jgi:hypothetical protein